MATQHRVGLPEVFQTRDRDVPYCNVTSYRTPTDMTAPESPERERGHRHWYTRGRTTLTISKLTRLLSHRPHGHGDRQTQPTGVIHLRLSDEI